MKRHFIFTCIALLAVAPTVQGASKSAGRARRLSASFRNRLTISPLIAAPGTFELDVINGFTEAGSYWLPTTLRFTPDSGNSYLKHTEWGINADLLDSIVSDGHRVSQFSDHVTFTSTTAAKWGGVNFGIAPTVTYLNTRGEGGFRFGGAALARVDPGLNSIGAILSWSGATKPNSNNPPGIWDLGFGFGRKLGANGLANHFTPHTSLTIEKQTAANRSYTILEGIEYQMNDRFSVDLSGQHVGISTGSIDHQILLGLNWTITASH